MVNICEKPRERTLSREWTNQTNAILSDAKATKTVSTKLRTQATAARRAIEKQTKEQQASVDEALRKKVADTTLLKNKVEKRMHAIQIEMDKLAASREKGQVTAAALVKPMMKSESRLQLREKRPLKEKIFDKVEKALGVELEELRKGHAQIEQLVKETEAHSALMLRCQQALKEDHIDKVQSLKLDMECLDLPGKTPKVSTRGGSDKLSGTVTSQKSTTLPALWRQNTERNINEACKLEHESSDMRKKVANIIHQVEEMRQHTHAQVQEALGNKVKQTTFLQGRLSQHMLDINTELESLEEQKENVVKTLEAKEVPLGIVRERLTIRKQRPTRETVRDSVEEALEVENAKLSSAIKSLRSKLAAIEEERERLLKAQRHIGQDMKDKSTSLTIDKKCLDLDQRSSSSTTGVSSRSDQSFRTPRQKQRMARADEFRHSGGKTKSMTTKSTAMVPKPPCAPRPMFD